MRHLIFGYFTVFASFLSGLPAASRSLAADNPKAQNRESKNMVAVGLANMPSSIDPVDAFSFQHFLVIQCLYQSLTRIAESGDLVSDLADSWHISADGRIYTFDLKKSLFQNGEQVTSNDVAVSLSRHMWPDSKSVVTNYLRDIIAGGTEAHLGAIVSGIKATSSSTVQITLVAPYPPFLSILAMPSFGIINAKELTHHKLVGSGPYVPRSIALPTGISLRRYDHYSGHRPALDGLEVKLWKPGGF